MVLATEPTCRGDVSSEAEDQLLSLRDADLSRPLREVVVAQHPQPGKLPAEVSAGQGGHQDAVGHLPPALEEHGDPVAASRLLQQLSQGGELAGLQR